MIIKYSVFEGYKFSSQLNKQPHLGPAIILDDSDSCNTRPRRRWGANINSFVLQPCRYLIKAGQTTSRSADGGSKRQSVCRTSTPNHLFYHREPKSMPSSGMIRQAVPASLDSRLKWGFRDLVAVNLSQSCLTLVDQESGRPLWQNSTSMATFGVFCSSTSLAQTEVLEPLAFLDLPWPCTSGLLSLLVCARAHCGL